MAVSPKTFAGVGLIAIVAILVAVAKTQTANLTPPAGTPLVEAQAKVAATASPAQATSAAAHPRKQLLFFMNPNGYPCQTQWGILNNVADSLLKVANVVYIKTTEPTDMAKFEAYGIRGLPSLVIADENGRELSRFAPGIQSADVVLAALSR